MDNLGSWLKAELRGDLDAASDYSAREWVAVVVETVVPLAVLGRVVAASLIWALNHNEEGAELNASLRGDAMDAEQWRSADEVQTAVFAAWVPIMVSQMPYSFGGPLVAQAWLAANAAVLLVLPVVAVVRVSDLL